MHINYQRLYLIYYGIIKIKNSKIIIFPSAKYENLYITVLKGSKRKWGDQK